MFILIDQLKKYIGNLPADTFFAITFDMWTSIANEGYLGITLHFIDSDWNLKKIIPCIKNITGSHNAENIAMAVKKNLLGWKVGDRIVAAVTDNASTMIKAVTKDLKYQHVPCAAHTLNLVVKSALEPILPLIEKCRRIVSHFNHSSQACDKLKKVQELFPPEGTKEKELLPVQDVVTRWNSTYYMVKRLLQLKESITSYSSVEEKLKENRLDDNEWKRMELLRNLLKPFNRCTQILSQEEYPSLSSFFIVRHSLLLHLAKDWNQSSLIFKVSEVLRRELALRFAVHPQKKPKSWQIAPLLDPRFKNLDWVSKDTQAQLFLKELYEEARKTNSVTTSGICIK